MKIIKTFLFCNIAFCSTWILAAQLPFHAVQYYPAFHASAAIAADFNQDGNPDLVMLDTLGKRLGVMKGDGNGGLGSAEFVESSKRLGAIATGKLNSDPFPDLAAIRVEDASLVIFLNRGDGSFGPATEYRLRNLPLGIAIGDLNGDLLDDIVIATKGEPTGFVQIFLGSPTGALQPLKAFSMPAPTSVAIGQFDGDQRLDLAVTSFHENSVAILQGNGNGEFTSLSKTRSTTGAQQIFAGDLDHDDRGDLVVLNIYNQVVFLHNTGNGHFDAPQTYQLKSLSGNVTIASDPSTPTVIVTDGSSIISFKRTGSGYSRSSFVFGYNSAIASADWNRDGQADLAVSIGDFNSDVAYVAIIPSIKNGFRLSPHFGEAASGSELDFNQDGHLDLIGTDSLFLGKGNGTFEKEPISGLAPIEYGDFMEAVFLNEDHAPDLAIIRPYGQSTFRLNNRHRKFGPEHALAPGQHDLSSILTFELNHDNHPDYISVNAPNFPRPIPRIYSPAPL